MIVVIDRGTDYKKGRYFIRIKAKNNKILCHSETYNTMASVKKAIIAIKSATK
jgi:uncharacterized protein YegP (UPF0339 family)